MKERQQLRFERFTLDLADRRLRCDGVPVDLNARYFDALALLVRESGALITKDRFLDEVWRGVPVTDEALTQGIKTLRRALGDDAAQPRFIETVPKHGYRFIADVDGGTADDINPTNVSPVPGLPNALLLGVAGIIGGGLAGLAGGVAYGFAGVVQPPQPGAGAISVLLVLLSLTTLVAIIGAAGVSFGVVAGAALGRRSAAAMVAGGALGGLIVGALVKLLGLDAFTLLFGQSPGQITGGMEGLLVGGAIGFAAWWSLRTSLRKGVAVAALAGGLAGLAIASLGGRMMAGSLDLLAARFPASRLEVGELGALLGDNGFGLLTQRVTCTLEGSVFAVGVVGAMILARRHLGQDPA